MAVLCVVIATGADGEEIVEVAREAASGNQFGRKVVSIGEEGCPPSQQLQQWTEGNAALGALFLRANGSLSDVLTIDQAKNFPAVDLAFARAAQ